VKFKIVQFTTARSTPLLNKLKRTLASTDDGTLFTSFALMNKVGCGPRSLQTYHPYLREFTTIFRNKRYFGNPATIKQLNQEKAR
jgi:hypothetical protein